VADDLRVVERVPSVEDYRRLRRGVGWNDVDEPAADEGLRRSLASFCLVDAADEVVGIARVVGDGGIYFYVQDVIVDRRYRGRGHGRALMDAVMSFIGREARPGAFVGLMAARGVTRFYERYGFEPRPSDRPGMSLTRR
jgi:ribosomal protein S18 acetylase RimI-like enzyme